VNIVEEIFLRSVAAHPAIVAGEVTLSFGRLNAQVTEVSVWLRQQSGFQTERTPRIGLACDNGVNYIILALAILKAGACLVPIAEELTATERLEVIARTALSGLVVGKEIGWRREDVVGAAEPSTAAGFVPLDSKLLETEQEFQQLDPAFVRFSSGTTGRSKGVVLSHEKLLERILAANVGLAIGPADKVLWMLPMAHHFAVSIVLYLYHGACTVLGTSHLAANVLATARATGATVIYGAPFHYALLAADTSGADWPELRLAVSTAAPLTESIAHQFQRRFDKRLVQGFGIIEMGLPLLNLNGTDDAPTSVGQPLPAYALELRDDEGHLTATGQLGELWLKGPGMFDAYLSPWQPAAEICVAGWFATGDLAVADSEGRIFLKGRKKSVINVSGMKVFPEEVELLIESHPAVDRSRVYGLAHPVLGTLPVAEVVLKTGKTLLTKELIQFCRQKLSAYKVPVKLSFVDELPTTASGKIRRF
jgi:long-chain acyl-CoA synthetase